MGTKTDNINGDQLMNWCDVNDFVIENTFLKSKYGDKEKLATWHSYNGNYSKQLDYIIIDKRYRNWIRNICNKENANEINPMQHRAIIAKIKIELHGNFFSEKREVCSKYDPKKFRANPSLANEDISKLSWDTRGDGEIWDKMQDSVIKILVKNTQ